jgi:hypothetical protein
MRFLSARPKRKCMRMDIANLTEFTDEVCTTLVHKHFSVRLMNVMPDKLHSVALRCALSNEEECRGLLHIGTQRFSKDVLRIPHLS